MDKDYGRSGADAPSGHSAEPEPISVVSAAEAASVPNAGDTVFGSFGHFGTTDVKRGTVKKVTPKGQLVVDFGEIWSGNGEPRLRRFQDPKGSEIGGEIYKTGRLISGADYAMLAKKQAGEEAATALMALLRSWSWRTKAELNELVAKLIVLADCVPDDKSTASAIEARRAADSEAGAVGDESATAESRDAQPPARKS